MTTPGYEWAASVAAALHGLPMNTGNCSARRQIRATTCSRRPNGRVVASVPRATSPMWRPTCTRQAGCRSTSCLPPTIVRTAGGFGVHAVFALDRTHEWLEIATELPAESPSYQSLTTQVMAAHWYERYAQDMFGIRAEGHPDGGRLVHHENIPAGTHPLPKDFAWDTRSRTRMKPYPMGTRRRRRDLPDPGRADSRRHHRAGPLPVQRRRRADHHARGKLFFTAQGVEKLLEGRSIERGDAVRRACLGRRRRLARARVLPGCRDDAGARSPTGRALRVLAVELERFTMHLHDSRTSAGWAPATP